MGLFKKKYSEEEQFDAVAQDFEEQDVHVSQLEQKAGLLDKLRGGPRLASRDTGPDDDDEGYVPQLAIDDPKVTAHAREESWFSIIGGWTRGIISFIIILAMLVAILYSSLSAFLMVYSPLASGDTNRSWVMRGTLGTNIIPAGTENIVVSRSTPAPYSANWLNSVFGWMGVGWAGIENPAVVTVVSSPGNVVHMDTTGIITLLDSQDREILSAPYAGFDPNNPPPANTMELGNGYLVQCASGDCEPGSVFMVEYTQVYGEKR